MDLLRRTSTRCVLLMSRRLFRRTGIALTALLALALLGGEERHRGLAA